MLRLEISHKPLELTFPHVHLLFQLTRVMARPGINDHSRRRVQQLQCRIEFLSLPKRHPRVILAMEDEGGRAHIPGMGDRRTGTVQVWVVPDKTA